MLRRLVERISRNRVIRRRLPAEFACAPLYVSPDSQLKYAKLGRGAFDAELLSIASEFIRPGMVVWDIGANVGVFTLASASLCKDGSVLAVEADIWLASLLTRSLNLNENKRWRVSVVHAAVSSGPGLAKFLVSARGRASSALDVPGALERMGGSRSTELVVTLSLDMLLDCFSPPDFVKIDIEGAEQEAIKGARRLMEEVRPIIYIEVGERGRSWIGAKLKEMGYVLYDGADMSETRKEISEPSFNTLAIPLEKV